MSSSPLAPQLTALRDALAQQGDAQTTAALRELIAALATSGVNVSSSSISDSYIAGGDQTNIGGDLVQGDSITASAASRGVAARDISGVVITGNIGFSAAQVEQFVARLWGATQQRDDTLLREQNYLSGLLLHKDFKPWDTGFIPLAGTMSELPAEIPQELRALVFEGTGPEQRIRRVKLEDLREAAARYQQFIVLGEPGAGKTTVLQKMTLEAARQRLLDPSARLPFFVRLDQHRDRSAPFDFLVAQWRQRVGGDGFADALRKGEVLLLADALNQMPRDGYSERVLAWSAFAHDHAHNQLIFTCRARDYIPQLASVQQVEIERLDDGRIQQYLQTYLSLAQADELWATLQRQRAGLLELVRNPFLLRMLVWTFKVNPVAPTNRGQLFERFVQVLLQREETKGHADWLPARVQVAALARLAFAMQREGQGTSWKREQVIAQLPSSIMLEGEVVPTPPVTIERLGFSASLLDGSADGSEVRFYHHLLQEFFAARELLRGLNSDKSGFSEKPDLFPLSVLWRVPLRHREMPPTNQGEWDPLPVLPTTHWEETTILAAGLAHEHDTRSATAGEQLATAGEQLSRLLDAVRHVNPMLAARCLTEGGVTHEDTRHALQLQLLSLMADRTMHLRARIAAGQALGALGDPRFVGQIANLPSVGQVKNLPYIPPPLVFVKGGSFRMGSAWFDRWAYPDERSTHQVAVSDFYLGQYPVTNAEFKCFMDAGGYQDEAYWLTDAAKRWLRGEDMGSGWVEEALRAQQALKQQPALIDQLLREERISKEQADAWRTLAQMSEDEVREEIGKQMQERSRTQPAFWDDSRFNGANQPVVGVTCFEALAYCAWLSAMTGQTYRLPTEAEWEYAARVNPKDLTGLSNLSGLHRYPWGWRWDATRANTLEGRVLITTPVGIYPDGVSACGAHDMAGNVWEWTSSLYVGYKYDANDGREDLNAEGRRVLRGGSWLNVRRNARCATRSRNEPTYFHDGAGLRVVRAPG